MLVQFGIFLAISIFAFVFAILFLDSKLSEKIAIILIISSVVFEIVLLKIALPENIDSKAILNTMRFIAVGLIFNWPRVKEFVKKSIGKK